MTTITVELYSEKAIVVRNTLEHHGTVLQSLGGTFNDRLKGGRGWIFPKHMLTQVRNVIEKLNSGQYGNEYEQNSQSTQSSSIDKNIEYVSKTEYLSVLSRLERLEAIVSNLSVLEKNKSIPEQDKSIPEQNKTLTDFFPKEDKIIKAKPRKKIEQKSITISEHIEDCEHMENDIPKRLTLFKK